MSSCIKLVRCGNAAILEPRPGVIWEERGITNPGAVVTADGKIHMLYKGSYMGVDEKGKDSLLSFIGHAVSADGFHFHPDCEPAIGLAGEDPRIFGLCGVEDPRISKLDDTYYIVYALRSACWDRLALASTKDFVNYRKHGLIVPDISQRTGALFPEKFEDHFLLIHRPRPNIWISGSPDLKSWGPQQILLRRSVLPWTEVRIGICAPPIRTGKAWAMLFHGHDRHGVCRMGIGWLDLKNPAKVLYVQPEPILEPEKDYEMRNGKSVYSCGAIVKENKVLVYYGAGNYSIAVASMPWEMLEMPVV